MYAHPNANPAAHSNPGAYQIPRAPSNRLGVAGFIISLVGVVATCGALAPVGLFLSTIALFKKPRGFAFAGVILGLIGTVIISIIAIAGIGAVGVAAQHAKAQQRMAERESAHIQIAALAERVGVFHQQNARPPLALDLLPYVDASMRTDPWGREYELEPDIDGFAIRSAGPDTIVGTDDDIRQAWTFVSEGVMPKPLPATPKPTASNTSEQERVPTPPTPPAAPDAPIAPTPAGPV